jgi:hypothetical protein
MEFDKAKMDAYKREAMRKYNLKTDENYNKWALADNNMIPQFIPELTNPNNDIRAAAELLVNYYLHGKSLPRTFCCCCFGSSGITLPNKYKNS